MSMTVSVSMAWEADEGLVGASQTSRVETACDRETSYHPACASEPAEASRRFSMVRQNELVRQ